MGREKGKILVIDDDEIKRYTIVKTLLVAGYETFEAVDGASGMRRAVEEPQPDVIVLDVNLPDISGLEVCKRLKANPPTAAIPVMQISAMFVNSDDRAMGLNVGADAYLTDSARPQEWLATVGALLRSRRAEEALRKQNARLHLLSQITGRLLVDEQPQAMVEEIFHKLAECIDADRFVFFLADEAARMLHLQAQLGLPAEMLQQFAATPYGQGACGTAAETGAAQIVTGGTGADPLLVGRDDAACIAQPIAAGQRLIGVVGFGCTACELFHEEEAALVRTVCEQIGAAIERKRLRDDLTQRNRLLAEADERKDDFMAMLGHELRNPLAAVSSAVEILRLRDAADETKRVADVAGRQIEHLVRLVDDLLDVSRMSRGKIKLKKQLTSLQEVIARTVESVTPLIESCGHELVVSLPEEPLQVQGDPMRLEQVLGNLLSNSAKYTDAGGRIELTAARRAGEVALLVRDNGIGIDQEHLDTLFLPFSQVAQSLDRSRGGLGLGLALVKTLVERHGGRVQAHSEGLGRGSEFRIDLPLVETPTAAQGKHEQPAAAPKAAREILVVDDNHAAAWMLQKLLEREGHQVTIAHDGEAGLEQILTRRPQIVFLDIGLPKLDGYQVAARVREHPELSNLVLVALTGYGGDTEKPHAHRAAFNYYLVKPAPFAQLQQILAQTASVS